MLRSKVTLILPEGYEAFLRDLKMRIRSAQVKAALSVNREMIVLYWEIGKALAERQGQAEWGKAVVERLARDLRNAFPDIKGFSRSNIYAMRHFFLTYRDADSNVQQLVGQIPLEVGGEDFYIDLLFYPHRLRCLVALDLKMGAFKPEYAGKMNFYLSALDDLVRHPDDALSLGIVLCQGKNQTIAEYALRDVSKSIGVSEYRLTHTLPGDLAQALPAPGDLERLMQEEGPESNGG